MLLTYAVGRLSTASHPDEDKVIPRRLCVIPPAAITCSLRLSILGVVLNSGWSCECACGLPVEPATAATGFGSALPASAAGSIRFQPGRCGR